MAWALRYGILSPKQANPLASDSAAGAPDHRWPSPLQELRLVSGPALGALQENKRPACAGRCRGVAMEAG